MIKLLSASLFELEVFVFFGVESEQVFNSDQIGAESSLLQVFVDLADDLKELGELSVLVLALLLHHVAGRYHLLIQVLQVVIQSKPLQLFLDGFKLSQVGLLANLALMRFHFLRHFLEPLEHLVLSVFEAGDHSDCRLNFVRVELQGTEAFLHPRFGRIDLPLKLVSGDTVTLNFGDDLVDLRLQVVDFHHALVQFGQVVELLLDVSEVEFGGKTLVHLLLLFEVVVHQHVLVQFCDHVVLILFVGCEVVVKGCDLVEIFHF